MLKFHPQKVAKIRSKDEALIFAATEGVDIIERLASSMKRKASIRELRKKIAERFFEYYEVDWKKLLPLKALPPKYNAGELLSRFKIRLRMKQKNERTRKNRYKIVLKSVWQTFYLPLQSLQNARQAIFAPSSLDWATLAHFVTKTSAPYTLKI